MNCINDITKPEIDLHDRVNNKIFMYESTAHHQKHTVGSQKQKEIDKRFEVHVRYLELPMSPKNFCCSCMEVEKLRFCHGKIN